MNPKKILKFDKEARDKLLLGVNVITDAVATTAGPKGRNVAFSKNWMEDPKILHDGVSVAREINLEDEFANIGAQLVRMAASKTNDVAGDGTTTAAILTRAIVVEGMKAIENGANPEILKKGIAKAVDAVVSELKKMAKEVVNNEEVKRVATISSTDEKIGTIIAQAIEKIGPDGTMTVDEGQSLEVTVDYKQGMEFDRGYISPYFITDTDNLEAVLENPYILVTDIKIHSKDELMPFLEKIVPESKNIVIIADEVEGEALALLCVNKIRGTFNPLGVRAPGFGNRRKELLEDIAAVTGATVINPETGIKLESIELKDLGRASKVISTTDVTYIVDGKGKESQVKARASLIRKALKNSNSEFDKEFYQKRLAKLAGGMAEIMVGAMTEVELKDKKERVIDAVAATRAAIEEGIIPGGGISLIRASKTLLSVDGISEDEKIGIKIVWKAIEAPLRKLLSNAGLGEDKVIQVLQASGNMGVDVMDGEFKDLVEAGIIDPVKVTRSALQNAASVASMCMTTDVLIVPAEKQKEILPE